MAISVSFQFSWAAQPGAWGPSLFGRWLSLPHLISNLSDLQTHLISNCSIGGAEGPLCWVLAFPTAACLQLTDFLSSPGLYNDLTSTLLPASVTIALIQHDHGQDFILIFLERIHLLFTLMHFLFWQPGRVGGPYTTRVCDEGHWHADTKRLIWVLPEVVGTVQQVYCSRRRLLRSGLEFHVCTINKSAHTKGVLKLIVWTSYIYIYIYMNFVEYKRFSVNIFYCWSFHIAVLFYSIRRELIDIFSLIVYFLSTSCPTLSHHQGKMYYKIDLTFLCMLLLCKKKSIRAVVVCSFYLINCSISSVSG